MTTRKPDLLAVRNDKELNKLLSGVTVAQVSALPKILKHWPKRREKKPR